MDDLRLSPGRAAYEDAVARALAEHAASPSLVMHSDGLLVESPAPKFTAWPYLLPELQRAWESKAASS